MNHIFEIECKIGDIFFHGDNDYKVMRVFDLHLPSKDVDKQIKTPILQGNFNQIQEGDRIRAFVEWIYDNRYGWELNCKAYSILCPENIEGIKHFLIRFCKGVGKNTATAITKELKEQTIDKIIESSDCLMSIKGISKKKAEDIRNSVLKHKAIEELSVFLMRMRIDRYSDIVEIYDALGPTAVEQIKQNPYIICEKIGERKFVLADSIALQLGYPPDSEMRLSRIIEFYLYNDTFTNGNIFSRYDNLRVLISRFLSYKKLPTSTLLQEEHKAEFDAIVLSLCDAKRLVVDETEEGKLVYPYWTYDTEVQSASILAEMLHSSPVLSKPDYEKFYNDFSVINGIELDDMQKKAIEYTYENRLVLITGGAGTGKTQTIKGIISFLKNLNKNTEISLIAPTGRAAKRMSEVSGFFAETVHRFIGLTVEGEIATQEIKSDYIICDESSMLSSKLFYLLLLAIVPTNATLVLVGDKDQLPPVDAGMPFRDLINSTVVPTVYLTTLFRQSEDSLININARKILSGDPRLYFSPNRNDFCFFALKDPMQIKDYIIQSMNAITSLGVSSSDMIVLSPMQESPLGVIALNQYLQDYFNPNRDKENYINSLKYKICENDRIMQTVNDYDNQVFNGDIGYVHSIDLENDEIILHFEDFHNCGGVTTSSIREVCYSKIEARDLILAYAVTVHKAQGCEYPVVFMPIVSMFRNMTRELIYTAITRAKTCFVMLGDYQSLAEGVTRICVNQRNSSLNRRLITKMSEKK